MMTMSEVTFDEESEGGWRYVGRMKDGTPKFRKFTNETEEYVREYLDAKNIAYRVVPKIKLFFVYKDKEPSSSYSPRYAYYYTTGQWGSDKRKKHYHSKGIDHFITKYYMTTEQTKDYWENRKKEKDE